MRNPNGFGSVYKLSGKRRKPWAARKTTGWNEKGQPIYEYIGYYETKADAMNALGAYNTNPLSIKNDLTLLELYDSWSREKYDLISDKNMKSYMAAWRLCEKIKNMPVKDIRIDHYQTIVDMSGKNTPTLKKFKIMLGGMYDYGVLHELVDPAKREAVRHLDVSKAGNPNSRKKTLFTDAEVAKLWNAEPYNENISIILIMIYSGVRISELLNLKKEDVHIDEKWFYVRESKTDAGVREVPIADKILPFFRRWNDKDCEYLICTPECAHMSYYNFKECYWEPLMSELGFSAKHKPHSTRYTCISKLTVAGVDERILKKIVGHKGQNVTEAVYTHIELPYKLEAINLI